MPTFRARYAAEASTTERPREETFEVGDLASAKFAADRLKRPGEELESLEAVVGA